MLLHCDWLPFVVLEQLSANHAREEIKRTAASVVWTVKYFSSSRISSPSALLSASGLADLFLFFFLSALLTSNLADHFKCFRFW